MCGKWKEGYDPNPPISLLRRISSINKEGKARFKLVSGYKGSLAILRSALGFSPDIPHTLQQCILARAVSQCVKRSELTPKQLVRFVARAEQDYRNRASETFVFVSTLSIKHFDRLRSRRLGGTAVLLSRSLPRRFDRAGSEQRLKDMLSIESPTNYTWIRVRVVARSDFEAVERSMWGTDLLRGIWNFVLNYGRFAILSSRPGPINNVVPGPLHTLHYPDGSLATETIWYDENYRRGKRPADVEQKWDRLSGAERFIRRRLVKSPVRDWLEEGFVRYARALDESRFENAYLKLWSLLEYLTGTMRKSYDKTIRRCLFLCRDADFARQELTHLRELRNRSVHSGEAKSEFETEVYQLNQYICRLFSFSVHRSRRFASFDEMMTFLDLPLETKDLGRRARLLSWASELRG